MKMTQINTGCVFRPSVVLLVSSIVERLRLKHRATIYATDTSRATATVLRFYLCDLCGSKTLWLKNGSPENER
jgi:hypothetical protein